MCPSSAPASDPHWPAERDEYERRAWAAHCAERDAEDATAGPNEDHQAECDGRCEACRAYYAAEGETGGAA